jgi:hypothetical protein
MLDFVVAGFFLLSWFMKVVVARDYRPIISQIFIKAFLNNQGFNVNIISIDREFVS